MLTGTSFWNGIRNKRPLFTDMLKKSTLDVGAALRAKLQNSVFWAFSLACCATVFAQASPPLGQDELRLALPSNCPKSATSDEIVVCGRRIDDQRYRIPKAVREQGHRTESSWTGRSLALEDASRAQRPGSNSPVGSGGQIGEREEMLRKWSDFRRKKAAGERVSYGVEK